MAKPSNNCREVQQATIIVVSFAKVIATIAHGNTMTAKLHVPLALLGISKFRTMPGRNSVGY